MHNNLVIQAVAREWPTEENGLGWLLLGALPQPPFAQTELLLHLWTKLPSTYFGEMLPGRYQGNGKDLTDAIAALHRAWPPPLDHAARELAAMVMPLIIRRESLAALDLIAGGLADRRFSPARIFEPYRDLLTPDFISP